MKTPTPEPAKVVDPVCGMRFFPEKAVCTLEHDGQTIYFCTQACRHEFERRPDRYAPRPASPGRPR